MGYYQVHYPGLTLLQDLDPEKIISENLSALLKHSLHSCCPSVMKKFQGQTQQEQYHHTNKYHHTINKFTFKSSAEGARQNVILALPAKQWSEKICKFRGGVS